MPLNTPANRTLWAVTSSSADIVKIYKSADPDFDLCAITDGAEVTIHEDVFLCPMSLDETLMHEFVHVLEEQFKEELKLPKPRNCTREAIVFGRELTRMLRQLRHVALDPGGP